MPRPARSPTARRSRPHSSTSATSQDPQQRQSSDAFPFLRLPGEIRNKIYDLVIPRSHVVVQAGHPQKEFQKLHKQFTFPKPVRYRLSGRILSIDDEEADPMGLLQSCRIIHDEATAVFYSKTTVCFENLSTVDKFFKCAPTVGLRNIRCLRLHVESYGEPKMTKNNQWKDKKDEKWVQTCNRIAATLVGLQVLELDLRLATWPTTLSSSEEWTRPLKILAGEGLKLVRLTLRHYRFNDTRLDLAARRLENEMMTEEGREERDLREALQAVREMEVKAAQAPKAKKVLIIKAPASDSKPQASLAKTKSNAKSMKTVYRTKGLAGYERIDLSTVGVSFIQCSS